MQKEPRQCLCIGSTPTRVMRVGPNYRSRLVVREIKKAMKKSGVPSAAELFSGMPLLESVYAASAKRKRTLAMFDISRAHFRVAPVQRCFVELPDDEKERLARENGHDLEHVGLQRKCMHDTVDASGQWQAHYSLILKKNTSFVQRLRNPSLFVCVERDVRLLVHGEDFMVEMPTHEEKWLEGVLFSKNDGKCTEKCHLDGSTAMEASFLHRVLRRDPTSGRAELEAVTRHVAMALRDLGLEKATPVVTPVARRPKAEELLPPGVAKLLNAGNTTLYRSVASGVNYLSRDRPDLSFPAGPGTRDEEYHDERPRRTQTCWALLARAIGWSGRV